VISGVALVLQSLLQRGVVMGKKFVAFEPTLFQFLRDLSKNNNREWFQENKPRYQSQVVAPVCDFVEAMQPRMEKITNAINVDPRPHGGSMFRIYRDARFSKDKRPYKENVGCHFRHRAGKDAHAPGYYIHLEPGNVFFGGGVWMPPADALAKIRDYIDHQQKRWLSLRNSNKIKAYGGIQGDGLQKPPRGYSAEHPCVVDLKRKSLFVMYRVDEAEVFDPSFLSTVTKVYKDIAPMMEFLTVAVGLPFHYEQEDEVTMAEWV